MRRLKVNKKSLLQRGGTPARKMAMDTDTILQDIREKVQGGVSEVEIFQNLMEQEIPLDEIQTAFSALGYDETMLSNIMEAIQQSASVQEEPIGEVQGSELPQAQYGQGFFGGNPFLSGTLATYHKSPDGYMPAKGFYLPQDLGNRGNIFGAISTATEAFSNLFSGKDLDGDKLPDGSLRGFGAKRRRHRDNKGSYYTYDVEYDPNDTNTYALDPRDLYAASKNRGYLRTTQQYTQDLLDNSMINYNVNTGQYETIISPNKIKANRFGKNDPNRNILEGKSFSDFYTTLKDNPAHLEMLAQQMGMIKGDYLPAGVSYGVDKDGSAASYFGANPYLYETMMGINVAKGDKSKDYTQADLNTNPYRISTGGLQNNVGISNANTSSNTNTTANTTANTTGSTSVNTETDPNATAVIDGVTYTVSDPVTKQEGGGFFDNFDFKGYLKGEQGLIPDYKGESTKKTVNTAIDKYGDAVNTGLDVAQTAMTAAGMVPVVGNVVDLVNTGVSGVRAGVAGLTGDSDGVLKHTENMAINAGSAIPGVGIGIGATGLAKDTATYTGLIDDKSIAANLGVGEPDFDKTQVTQAIGVGNQGDAKSKAGRGYELPYYQAGGANTLYEYYDNLGLELPSVAERRPAFQEAFGENAPYTGTAAQNTQFLEYLQSTDNPAPSSNTNMPNTETPVEEVSTPENDPNFIGPLNFDPNANQTNSDFPDADGDGIPDTIDIDAGTGTGESVVGDNSTTSGTQDSPDIQDIYPGPKVTRRNKFAGTVNRIMDSPGMKAFADVSGAAVAGANVVNAFFDERNFNKAKEDLVFMGMADKAYGMYEERDGDRGNFDENTGLMQPDNMRGYMARMGTETFMQPPIKQEENIMDLDYKTVAKLISAGADIEIL